MLNLFSPLAVGPLALPNRIIMAPLTRVRAEGDHNPSGLMVTYYSQRATAGLVIAEATMAMQGNSAFSHEPGIYSEAQIAGWRNVTHAVHAAGGRIFLQVWHGGRACHSLLNNGAQPVAPSAIAIIGDEVHTLGRQQSYVIPRALHDDEIPTIIEGFRRAAINAKSAGFDGIEIHGANGYLLDEFLRDGSNKRNGPYGGALENRPRLLLEVLAATISVWGPGRVGLGISPLNSYNSMNDSDPVGLTIWLATKLNHLNIAYFHLMRGDFSSQQTGDVMKPARKAYTGVLIGNMGYSAEEANDAITSGKLDAVAFGTFFLANPDLPARIATNAPLNTPDPATFYSQGSKGYTDYPAMPAA